MAKLPVSVCMISGTEAGRIGRALQSVSDWAAEVIVVLNEDAHDGTDAVCEAQGAKVFREPWKGFVPPEEFRRRRKGLQPVDSVPGCDEEVPPGSGPRWRPRWLIPIRPALPRLSFPRCSWYCGRWTLGTGDWHPDRVVRLWRKGAATFGRALRIHERLEVKGAVGRLHSDLRHYSNQSINGQLKKIGPYADPFVRHRLESGRSAGWLDLTIRPVWKSPPGLLLSAGLPGWLARLLHRLAGGFLHGDPLRQGAKRPASRLPHEPLAVAGPGGQHLQSARLPAPAPERPHPADPNAAGNGAGRRRSSDDQTRAVFEGWASRNPSGAAGSGRSMLAFAVRAS